MGMANELPSTPWMQRMERERAWRAPNMLGESSRSPPAAAVILAVPGLQGWSGHTAAGKARSAVTTRADWKPVADALGRSGRLGDNNTASDQPAAQPSHHVLRCGHQMNIVGPGTRLRPIRQQRNAADGRPRDHRGGVAQGHRCVTGVIIAQVLQASAAARPAGVVDPFTAWVMPPIWPKDSGGVGFCNDRPAYPTAGTAATGRSASPSTRRWAARNPRWWAVEVQHPPQRHHRRGRARAARSVEPDDGDRIFSRWAAVAQRSTAISS